ncbi:hypothetical protein D3C81_1254560 [compost metagenome]
MVKAQLDAFQPLIILSDNTDQPGGILAHRIKAAEVLLGADAGQMQLTDIAGIIIFNLTGQIDKTLMGVGLDLLLHLGQRHFQHVGQALPTFIGEVGMAIENMFGIQHDIA